MSSGAHLLPLDCHATGETHEGGEAGDVFEAAQVERRLSSVAQELGGLRDMPGQLNRVLDILEKLQARLVVPEPPLVPTSPKNLHEAHAQLPGASAAPGEGTGLTPVSGRPRQRWLQPMLTESSLRRSLTKSSCDSDDSKMRRPLIGQPAQPAAESSPPPGVRQRRPSTQSDDPRAMQIYRQRRPSTELSGMSDASRRPSSQISAAGSANGNASPRDAQEGGSECENELPVSSVGLNSWMGGATKKMSIERKSSTCSSNMVAPARFDAVLPNSIPCAGDEAAMPNVMEMSDREEESEADTHTKIMPAMTSVPEWDSGVTSRGADGGARGSHPTGRGIRPSYFSNLSLGGEDSRHSIDCSVALDMLRQDKDGFEAGKWVLQPNSILRRTWDLLMVMLTISVGLVVSVVLSYRGDDAVTSTPYVVFLNVASGLWVFDIVANFSTGFYHQGKVVRSPLKIAERYIHRWFILDLLSACPLVTSTSLIARVLSSFKLARLPRIVALLVGKQQDHALLGLPSRVCIMVLITTMTTTCLWRLTVDADEAISGATSAKRLQEWWEVFVTDIYWVTMTMSTVGFGDIAPAGTFSRIFAILAMLIAPIFFGTIVSLLTHVTQSIFNDETEVQVAEAIGFMRQRRLTEELQQRVEHNLRYQINQERLTLKPALFAKLSTAVQREISLELLRSSVLNFPLFRGVQHSFIAELAQAHAWVQCSRGDLVVEEGQLVQEVVFVIRGRLLMHQRVGKAEGPLADALIEEEEEEEEEETSEDGSEVELGAGAWFGEEALFFEDTVRAVTAVAVRESELAVLRSVDYHRIVQKYPRLQKRHRAIAKALRIGSLSLKDVAYTSPAETLSEESSWRMRMASHGAWGWLRRFFSGGH